jgi:predicted RNA-binding Zn-ribbon protein involved in translation (DUF1610 family)
METRLSPLVRIGYRFFMEQICSGCHAVMGTKQEAGTCPACGEALVERASLAADQPLAGPPAEVDRRGIVLPRRHALGGVITPQ